MKRLPYELNVQSLPLNLFDYHKESNLLSAEASSLGESFRIQPFYNDACDEGIAIRSHHTGKVEKFVLTKVDTDDGDIMGWNFAPVNRNCPVKQVLVVND